MSMTELSLNTPDDQAPPPRRRRSDGGFRALFQPKAVIVAVLTIAGFMFSAGKWVGAGEHNDASLEATLAAAGVKLAALEERTRTDSLDHRYVTYDALHAEINGVKADLDWIKRSLGRLEDAQKSGGGRRE